MYMQNLCARVRNKMFAIHSVLNSHLSHKRTWQPFSQQRDAHDDTKNIWSMSNRFRENSWKELKLVPSFSRSSLLLAWRSCTLMKIECAIALLTMMGNRMEQEASQYYPRFRTYARWKKCPLIMIMTSASKKILRIKKVHRICGVTAYVIAFTPIFRQASKSNNIGCDPTNPMYLFYSENFFTSTCLHSFFRREAMWKQLTLVH